MSGLEFALINAFTSPPSVSDTWRYSGNPAAVVLVPPGHPLETDSTRSAFIARDFNLSETAYVVPRPSAREDELEYGLRWWTPATEIDLCGHATLAAASFLFARNPSAKAIHFHTRVSGILIAVKQGEEIRIDLPIIPLADELTPKTTEVVEAFAGSGLGESHITSVVAFPSNGRGLVIQLNGDADLSAVKPDFDRLTRLAAGLIILTQPKEKESTPETLVLHDRVFAPGYGVNEDPVCGSAHALLVGYYLSQTPQRKLEAIHLGARGGRLVCSYTESGDRAYLTGQTVEYAAGTLQV